MEFSPLPRLLCPKWLISMTSAGTMPEGASADCNGHFRVHALLKHNSLGVSRREYVALQCSKWIALYSMIECPLLCQKMSVVGAGWCWITALRHLPCFNGHTWPLWPPPCAHESLKGPQSTSFIWKWICLYRRLLDDKAESGKLSPLQLNRREQSCTLRPV